MYLVPSNNGLFFGKVVRIDMRDFKKLADKQQEHAATLAEQRADDGDDEEQFDGTSRTILNLRCC